MASDARVLDRVASVRLTLLRAASSRDDGVAIVPGSPRRLLPENAHLAALALAAAKHVLRLQLETLVCSPRDVQRRMTMAQGFG